MFFYIKLDKNNVVRWVSQSPEQLDDSSMIQVDCYAEDRINYLYHEGNFIQMIPCAVIDNHDIVVGFSEWREDQDPPPYLIKIDEISQEFLGKRYINGKFLPLPEKITFETIQAREFAAEVLGVEFEISPQETLAIARTANFEPIQDGKEWQSGLNLSEGTIVRFNNKNYRVLQGHISQAGWSPTNVPALFKEIRDPYTEWQQPQGAHDAYMAGDVVMFQDQLWRSTINGNVWQPGTHGWELV